MATLALESNPPDGPRPVASLGHTLALIAIMLGMAAWGAIVQHRAAAHGADLPRPGNLAFVYLPLLVMEWGLVLYVVRGGLRRTGTTLRQIIGGRWARPADVAIDLALGIGVWGVWTLLSYGIERMLGSDQAASVGRLLPRHPFEILMWIALSLSAGFSEELVFRGYFQSQFLAFTHRVGLALILQALLFGVSHGYQGVRACATITIYGALMGGLAAGRKSLRPGMIAHAWTDIASGIFRI